MEDEEDLAQDNMCNPAEIIRQTTLIEDNAEMRRLEREKYEAEELVREHFKNSSPLDLDNGNTQGLAPAVDYCYVKETDDSNLSEEEEHCVINFQPSESESSKLSSSEEIDNDSCQPSVRRRSDITANDLDIGELFITSVF